MNFVPPQECAMRLDDLNELVPPEHEYHFFFQDIDKGNTPLTNVDYFSVEISQVPDFDLNGTPDSPDEILESIRSNFVLLSIGTDQPLYPTCPDPLGLVSPPVLISWSFEYMFPEDINLWNSTQPLTTMFTIDGSADQVLANLISDDGAVMISQYVQGCCWIFTALETPFTGLQPFGGNRQFGITLNSNGNYEFYTKAIDRANVNTLLKFPEILSENCDAVDYYEIANLTWSSLCGKVVNYINSFGGNAQINNTLQKFVDYKEVLEMLKSETPISLVPCN